MDDYEIRDVMHRATKTEASIRFSLYSGSNSEEPNAVEYRGLRVVITNEGSQVINYFKVTLKLINVGYADDSSLEEELVEHYAEQSEVVKELWHANADGSADLTVVFRPDEVLFPKETVNLGKYIKWGYPYDHMQEEDNWREMADTNRWAIEWTFYADDMPFKQGISKISALTDFH